MKKLNSLWLLLTVCIAFISPEIKAQESDTIKKYQDSTTLKVSKTPFFRKKLVRATLVPTVLIGYGISTIKDNGLYSSYQAKADLQKNYPKFHTDVDDFLIYAPFVELALAYGLQVKGNHDLLNTGILIVKAEAINTFLVFGLKKITKQERPDGSNSYSFPSGHAAHAFLAASIIHSELRHRSQWYGVGAYTIATSVGVLRMLNNKHWQSDVIAGAGFGILSSHLAYLSHRNRWGKKPRIAVQPTILYGVPALGLSIDLNYFKPRESIQALLPAKVLKSAFN